MAKQLMQCIRKCAWYPLPPDKYGEPTCGLKVYDPENAQGLMDRRTGLPMNQELIDPSDPYVIKCGILGRHVERKNEHTDEIEQVWEDGHFIPVDQITPEMVETPMQFEARCGHGVKAPLDHNKLLKIAGKALGEQVVSGSASHVTKQGRERAAQE